MVCATSYAQQQPPIVCPDIPTAESGSMVDAYYLGKAYDEGYCNLPQSKDEAEHWYRLAAGQGHMLAQYEMGETYFTGDGFALDYPEAKKWYGKAAGQGHGLSQLRMGFLNAENHFKPLQTDYAEAEKWFLKAAEQNAAVIDVVADRVEARRRLAHEGVAAVDHVVERAGQAAE